MELLASLVPLALSLSLACLVATIGMQASWEDLASLFRQPQRLGAAVLAVNVAVPAAAVLLLAAVPVAPAAKAGVLLMAVAPAPPLTAFRHLDLGEHRTYAFGLYFALIALAVVAVPLSVTLLARFYGVEVGLSAGALAGNVALMVMLPLAVGMLVRRLAPGLVGRIDAWVGNIAVVLLVIAFFPIPVVLLPAIESLAGDGTLMVMGLVAAAGLAAGHLLGGPGPIGRKVLAVTAANRHPGIALILATANGADSEVFAAILAVFLTGAVASGVYETWASRRPVPLDGIPS
jgi:bile acid:Na+ symporter, BASS family